MEECPICYRVGENLTQLWPCQHFFCSDCLHKQLRHDGRCAVCRAPFGDTMPPLFHQTAETQGVIRPVVLSRQKKTGTFGVSLYNLKDKVIVRHVKWRHVLRSAMCSGTELVAVNSIPCYSASAALHLLHAGTLSHVVFHIRRDTRTRWLERLLVT